MEDHRPRQQRPLEERAGRQHEDEREEGLHEQGGVGDQAQGHAPAQGPEAGRARDGHAERGVHGRTVAPHRAHELVGAGDQVDERHVGEEDAGGGARHGGGEPVGGGGVPAVLQDGRQGQGATGGKQHEPEAEDVDHGVVEVGGQDVPAQGGDGGGEEEERRDAGVVAGDDEKRGGAGGQVDRAEEDAGHARLKEADPGGGEEPNGEAVVDEAVGIAEVAGLAEGVEEVEEEDGADEDAGDVQGEGGEGGGEGGQVVIRWGHVTVYRYPIYVRR